MQYLHDNRSAARKNFDMGWRALVLGVTTIVLSLIVSVVIVNAVEALVA